MGVKLEMGIICPLPPLIRIVLAKVGGDKTPTAQICSTGLQLVVLPYKNARVTLLLHKLRMDAAALDGVITDVDNT